MFDYRTLTAKVIAKRDASLTIARCLMQAGQIKAAIVYVHAADEYERLAFRLTRRERVNVVSSFRRTFLGV